MHRPALLLALALAACSPEREPAGAMAGEPVACAHGAGGDWVTTCRIERTVEQDRDLVIVRRTDGAFRRFVVIDGGRSVVAADGAARVSQRRLGSLLEVSLGDDRYRLPLAADPLP